MNWDFTVTSKRKLIDIRLRELIRYRDLILMLFIRDFTVIYKQTVLGPLWHVLSPLLSTFVYAFVFGSVAGVGTDGIPVLLFYYGGTVLWTYFSSTLSDNSDLFRTNAGLYGKVYFPRLAAPIASAISSALKMLIQFTMLLAFLAYYIITGSPVRPTLGAFLFPLMLIWLGALGAGFGMICSAFTTKYRDLNHVLALIIRLAMFVTPVVFPLSEVPERLRLFFYINPVSAPMELFRVWFYGVGYVSFSMILLSIAITITVVALGLIFFTRTERTSMDVI